MTWRKERKELSEITAATWGDSDAAIRAAAAPIETPHRTTGRTRLLMVEGVVDGRDHVKALLVAERADLAPAFAGMPKIEEQAVIAQAMAEDLHGQHLHAGAVLAVAIDDRSLRHRGRPARTSPSAGCRRRNGIRYLDIAGRKDSGVLPSFGSGNEIGRS